MRPPPSANGKITKTVRPASIEFNFQGGYRYEYKKNIDDAIFSPGTRNLHRIDRVRATGISVPVTCEKGFLNVELHDQRDSHLRADTVFRWKTFGAPGDTEIADLLRRTNGLRGM